MECPLKSRSDTTVLPKIDTSQYSYALKFEIASENNNILSDPPHDIASQKTSEGVWRYVSTGLFAVTVIHLNHNVPQSLQHSLLLQQHPQIRTRLSQDENLPLLGQSHDLVAGQLPLVVVGQHLDFEEVAQ